MALELEISLFSSLKSTFNQLYFTNLNWQEHAMEDRFLYKKAVLDSHMREKQGHIL